MSGLCSVGCRARTLISPYELAGRGENDVPCRERFPSAPAVEVCEEGEEPAFSSPSFAPDPSDAPPTAAVPFPDDSGTGGGFTPLSSPVSRFFVVLNVKNPLRCSTVAAPASRPLLPTSKRGAVHGRAASGGRYERREEGIAVERGLFVGGAAERDKGREGGCREELERGKEGAGIDWWLDRGTFACARGETRLRSCPSPSRCSTFLRFVLTLRCSSGAVESVDELSVRGWAGRRGNWGGCERDRVDGGAMERDEEDATAPLAR
jgi:hypothetical protein